MSFILIPLSSLCFSLQLADRISIIAKGGQFFIASRLYRTTRLTSGFSIQGKGRSYASFLSLFLLWYSLPQTARSPALPAAEAAKRGQSKPRASFDYAFTQGPLLRQPADFVAQRSPLYTYAISRSCARRRARTAAAWGRSPSARRACPRTGRSSTRRRRRRSCPWGPPC